ncbi:MAG TPA: hypothetical protein VEU72_02910 [Nitrosopumilaceae archaeon]|nr:hypothetical protein [Nitrosopumilaceae archaeon]
MVLKRNHVLLIVGFVLIIQGFLVLYGLKDSPVIGDTRYYIMGIELLSSFAGIGLLFFVMIKFFQGVERKESSKPMKKPNLKVFIIGESIFLVLSVLAYIKFGSPNLLYLFIAGLIFTVPAFISRKRKYDQSTQTPSNIS